MAPPRKFLDLAVVDQLAADGLTNDEIAQRLGVSKVHLWRSGWRRDPLPAAHEINWGRAQEMLDDGAFMADVADYFGVSEKTLRRRRIATGLPPLEVKPRVGDRAPAWGGGRFKNPRGYVHVYAPEHPHAASGYVREHRLVMEEKIGRLLRPEEVVHHINDVKHDNRPENLELFPNNAAHLAATTARRFRMP